MCSWVFISFFIIVRVLRSFVLFPEFDLFVCSWSCSSILLFVLCPFLWCSLFPCSLFLFLLFDIVLVFVLTFVVPVYS